MSMAWIAQTDILRFSDFRDLNFGLFLTQKYILLQKMSHIFMIFLLLSFWSVWNTLH